MIGDSNRVYDGWASLEAGVDAGKNPSILEPNKAVSAENMSFRGGQPSTRPGWKKLNTVVTNAENSYYSNGDHAGDVFVPNENASAIFETGIFQCATWYSPHNGEDCIMAVIGGRLFKIIPGVNDAVVTEINLPTRSRNDLPIAYMLQADKWLIIQDGDSAPVIYDSTTARRSKVLPTDPEKAEVPTGTIMAYGMGRIVVVVRGRDIAFGDLYGSHESPDPADSLILFTERNFLAEGFDAAIPFHQGLATGMEFFPQLDTSTGNGQLMVFAEKGANSFFLSIPREEWKTSKFQILALRTASLRGHRSISIANEDLWFRSTDGFRSYRQARSETTGWAHIPLSTNVRQYTENDSKILLKFASSIYFDNRIMGTCTPVWNRGRPYHEGILVVDFDIISSFGEKASPAWEGHWIVGRRTKMNLPQCKVLQLLTAEFNGVGRAFAFGLDEDNNNQLFELSPEEKNDWDNQPIEWELVNRMFDFGKTEGATVFSENEIYDGDIWIREIAT
jgi:hypothetical protein